MAFISSAFTAGQTLTAASMEDLRGNANAGHSVFTNEAARDAAITAPTKGMMAYLTAPTTPTRTAGALTVYDGSVWVNVTPQGASFVAGGTTTSLTYADLATAGPSVTMVTGTTALVTVVAEIGNTGGNQTRMSVAVSGATTLAASDDFSAVNTTTSTFSLQRTTLLTGLTAGTNTFAAKYRVSAGTGNFYRCAISAVGIA